LVRELPNGGVHSIRNHMSRVMKKRHTLVRKNIFIMSQRLTTSYRRTIYNLANTVVMATYALPKSHQDVSLEFTLISWVYLTHTANGEVVNRVRP